VEPPEEDEAFREKEYAFNPLQAQKEMTVGNFYFKKGSFRAAAIRYAEAVKWNPGFGDAWFRLGETYEKLGEKDKAIEAYEKLVEVQPDHKKASEARKKIGKKPSQG
jgi:tetratricopeptide (TPR) repeat protein